MGCGWGEGAGKRAGNARLLMGRLAHRDLPFQGARAVPGCTVLLAPSGRSACCCMLAAAACLLAEALLLAVHLQAGHLVVYRTDAILQAACGAEGHTLERGGMQHSLQLNLRNSETLILAVHTSGPGQPHSPLHYIREPARGSSRRHGTRVSTPACAVAACSSFPRFRRLPRIQGKGSPFLQWAREGFGCSISEGAQLLASRKAASDRAQQPHLLPAGRLQSNMHHMLAVGSSDTADRTFVPACPRLSSNVGKCGGVQLCRTPSLAHAYARRHQPAAPCRSRPADLTYCAPGGTGAA